MHIRANIYIALLKFPSSRSLSLYISEKKRKSFLHFRFNLPANSTAPHQNKSTSNLDDNKDNASSIFQVSDEETNKKTEENNAWALPEEFCRKKTPMWIEMQTQTIPIRETMRSQWSGIQERTSREMEARQRSAGRERKASRQRKGRAKKKAKAVQTSNTPGRIRARETFSLNACAFYSP